MKDDKEYKPLTHEQLVAEALLMIKRAEEWQIQKAVEAAMAVKEENEV